MNLKNLKKITDSEESEVIKIIKENDAQEHRVKDPLGEFSYSKSVENEILNYLIKQFKAGNPDFIREYCDMIDPKLLNKYVDITKDYDFEVYYRESVYELYDFTPSEALKFFEGTRWYYPDTAKEESIRSDKQELYRLIQNHNKSGEPYSEADTNLVLNYLLDEHKEGKDDFLQEYYDLIDPKILYKYFEISDDDFVVNYEDFFVSRYYDEDPDGARDWFEGTPWYYPEDDEDYD